MYRLIMALLLLASSGCFAAGGGGMGGGSGSLSAPVERKSPEQLAVIAYNKGIKHRDKAWAYLEEAKQQTSERKAAKLQRRAEKEFKKAAKRFRSAIKYVPNLYEAHASLGYALRKIGEHDDSLAAYNESLRLNPDYAEAIEYRGETYLALGRIDDAKAAYMRLVTLQPAMASQLLDAFEQWLSAPPQGSSEQIVSDLRRWVDERRVLGAQLGTGQPAASWSVQD